MDAQSATLAALTAASMAAACCHRRSGRHGPATGPDNGGELPPESTEALSFVDYQPNRYQELLTANSSRVVQNFRDAGLLPQSVQCEVHASIPSHYRLRCGFGIYDPERADEWRLPCAEALQDRKLRYVYWDNGSLVPVEGNRFPIASRTIYDHMPAVLERLDSEPSLRADIRAAKFHSTMNGELLITLVYKQRSLLEPAPPGSGGTWRECAAALSEMLSGAKCNCVGVIGRSKGVKECVGQDWVVERGIVLSSEAVAATSGSSSSPTSGGGGGGNEGGKPRPLIYRHPEQAFSNPNGGMAIHTLNWLCSCTSTIRTLRQQAEPDLGAVDLLELCLPTPANNPLC